MKALPLLLAVCTSAALFTQTANAATVLGTGTAALLGGDLTDPENDGLADSDVNYNAVFTGNEEPGFGGGEFAFNIFDNRVGGGQDKWCCGSGGGNLPFWVDATFAQPIVLTHFTLASGNDSVPARDPRAWRIQGSNDGVVYTDIFVQGVDGTSPSVWTATNQVIRWDGAGADFATPAAYSIIRYQTDATANTGGAHHHLNEFEIFGTTGPVLDSDNDGLPDAWEIDHLGAGAENDDGSINVDFGPAGDPDNDNLLNEDEFSAGTRGDDPDTDADGYNDGVETGSGNFVDLATDTGTDPLDDDTDDDGLLDGVETDTGVDNGPDDRGTDPHDPDTDADGRPDGYELDNGQDPLADTDGGLDPDNDDLDNDGEFAAGTDPNDDDSDDDTLLDGHETNTGTYNSPTDTGSNPLSNDTDGDSLLDGDEVNATPANGDFFSDPNLTDTDGDLAEDGVEVAGGFDPNDANSTPPIPLITLLGTGTAALLGGDLTDPEDDGLPDEDTNYNAIFTSSIEPGFGGGENAFNVFDNQVGGGNAKWCCDGPPQNVTAEFAEPVSITHFTITSGNDSTNRDPTDWEIQGSNDGVNFTPIFQHTTGSIWTERNQVALITLAAPSDAFSFIRYQVNATGSDHQLSEIEYFGELGPQTPIQITDILYDQGADTFRISWTSKPGKFYTLRWSPDLINWGSDVSDNIPSQGESTTYPAIELPAEAIPAGPTDRIFFRIEENP